MSKFCKCILAGTLVACSVMPTSISFINAQEDELVNYALHCKATAEKSPIEYWGPDKLVDGIVNRDAPKSEQSRWSSESGAPSWVMLDLQNYVGFEEIDISWENTKVRKFHIEMSDDGEDWSTIYTSEDKTDGHPLDTKIDFGHKFYGRFIRVTVDSLIDGAYPSVSIYEVSVLGPKKDESSADKEFRINYALDTEATASQSPIDYWGPDKLVDGIINRNAGKQDQSRWSSEAGAPAWVQINLKQQREFDEIMLAFEKSGTVEKFHIETSDDGKQYTTVYESEDKAEGYPEDTHVYLDAPIKAQYVRITVDKLTEGTYPSVSLYEVEVIGTHKMTNLARSANVSSNGDETDAVKVQNINDGNLDTRWGSSYGLGTKQITFDFDEKKSIQSFILEWERKTIKEFVVEAKVDGEWKEIFKQDELIKNFQQIINLDTPVETDGIRLTVTKFNSKGADREGVVVDYPTISLYEVEMYGEKYELPPRDPATTTQDIANEVVLDEISDDATKIPMPQVPEGYSTYFLGADYEQVVSRDLKIIKPLVDTEVVLNFEVVDEKTKEKAVTPDLKLKVKGKYTDSQNEKPVVLPELQQWYGTTGTFEVTKDSKIVVDPAYPQFKKAAQLFKQDYKDVMDKDLQIVEGTNPAKGDFYFTGAKENLDEETYYLDINDAVTIKADQYTGSYWGTRSVLQILKQTGGSINKGIAKDYPKYEVRGMMLDVARLPVDMYFLEDLVKTMSWYKMNDFQVHLNDNVFSSTNGIPDYSGFRLESDVENLTNTDVYYSKEEFRNFILNSDEMGVNIVPEFDSPGHSGAFTRARPDLARKDNASYLDVENPDSIEFIKSVFNEYTSGENPVYPKDTVVHVGTDEYKQGNKEAFRKYQDDLLRFIRDEQGYTPRVWGSQTENNGTTPITVDGVQMNLWYTGYANPREMYEKGYDLINTNDGDLYIVPGAGYYYDYLNQGHIYGNWKPNEVGGFKIPVGDDQMLGSTFAVWNDKTGPKDDNGTSNVELFDRIYHIMPTFGAKLWGDIKDYSLDELNQVSAKTNYAPNSNPTYQVESKGDTYVDYNFNNKKGTDTSGNNYDLEKQENVAYAKGIHNDSLELQGGTSYVETPIDDIGLNTTLDFWVNKDKTDSDEEQILFESELGTIKAVQKDTGKFGFSRWHRDYSFNYTLPENEWVHIQLVTEFTKTSLYVNGEKVDELSRTAEHGNKWASLILPISRIGSETHAFKGQIDDVVVYKNGKEVPDVTTRWLEQEIELAQSYLENSDIYTKDSIEALKNIVDEAIALLDKEGYSQEEIDTMTQSVKDAIQNLKFAEDKDALKALIDKAKKLSRDNYTEESWNIFEKALDNAAAVYEDEDAQAADIKNAVSELQKAMDQLEEKVEVNKKELSALIKECKELKEVDYAKASWDAFTSVLDKAEKLIADEDASQKDVDAMVEQLNKAKDQLVQISDLYALLEQYGGYRSDEYTKETWTPFKDAYDHAKKVYQDPEATQEDVASAIAALKDSAEKLVKYDKDSTDDGDKGDSDKEHEDVEITEKPQENPKTGVESRSMEFAALAIASMGMLVYFKKRKDNKLKAED